MRAWHVGLRRGAGSLADWTGDGGLLSASFWVATVGFLLGFDITKLILDTHLSNSCKILITKRNYTHL